MPHHRFSRAIPCALLAVLAAATHARAATTRFNPSLTLSGGHTDNVEYVGSTETSDTVTSIGLELPVEREWQRGSMRFAYAPSYYKYLDQEALDHDEHRVDLDWNNQLSQKSNLRFASNFSRTQLQGDARLSDRPDVEDVDLTLTERTNRDSYAAVIDFTRDESARWNWGLSGRWGQTKNEAIEEFNPSSTSIPEDRTEYGGSWEVGRELARDASLGLRYEFRRADLEGEEDDEDTHLLSLDYEREISRRTSIALALGGSRSTGDVAGGAPGETERTEVQGEAELRRTYRHARLSFTAAHQPSSGGHLAGTSTNTGVGVQVSSAGQERWLWSVSSRYARRDPVRDDEPTLDTVALGASIERSIERLLGIRFSANYTDQSGDSSQADRSVLGAAASVVWYPLGRAAIGRGVTGEP